MPPLGKPPLRLLLVEDDAWNAALVEEALAELEEHPSDSLLPRETELSHALTSAEAMRALESTPFDLIVLDLAVGGEPSLLPFLELRDLAPGIPLVLLSAASEEPLALAAVREGAAGYLMLDDIDAIPLARALRAALDRQHALAASRGRAHRDELTGLASRESFLARGESTRTLAGRWAKSGLLSVLRLDGSLPRAGEDLALIETGDLLREVCEIDEIAARTGPRQFAVLSFDPTPAEPLLLRIERCLSRRPHSLALASLRFHVEEFPIQSSAPPLSELLDAAHAAAAMPQ